MRPHLEEFGESAGLFTRMGIHKLGRKSSDPFQIEVKHPTGGPSRNLVDVGYGVSQVVPILVDSIRATNSSTLLVQQPEVHLHPRAQAELGTFFGGIASSGGRSVIVETHSDYLLDRVRLDIRDRQNLSPDDVQILYFEHGQRGVIIHQLEIDEEGNIVGAPPSYRRFFMEEERRFFKVGI